MYCTTLREHAEVGVVVVPNGRVLRGSGDIRYEVDAEGVRCIRED